MNYIILMLSIFHKKGDCTRICEGDKGLNKS